MVEGDFENEAELTELDKRLLRCFWSDNFWEHFGNEFRQGKNLVNAVHASRHKTFRIKYASQLSSIEQSAKL